jgi:hypothetical protein
MGATDVGNPIPSSRGRIFLMFDNCPKCGKLRYPKDSMPGQLHSLVRLRQFLTRVSREAQVLLQQMPPQDGDFLFRRIVLPLLLHRSLHYLNGGTLSPFPAEPEHSHVTLFTCCKSRVPIFPSKPFTSRAKIQQTSLQSQMERIRQ